MESPYPCVVCNKYIEYWGGSCSQCVNDECEDDDVLCERCAEERLEGMCLTCEKGCHQCTGDNGNQKIELFECDVDDCPMDSSYCGNYEEKCDRCKKEMAARFGVNVEQKHETKTLDCGHTTCFPFQIENGLSRTDYECNECIRTKHKNEAVIIAEGKRKAAAVIAEEQAVIAEESRKATAVVAAAESIKVEEDRSMMTNLLPMLTSTSAKLAVGNWLNRHPLPSVEKSSSSNNNNNNNNAKRRKTEK